MPTDQLDTDLPEEKLPVFDMEEETDGLYNFDGEDDAESHTERTGEESQEETYSDNEENHAERTGANEAENPKVEALRGKLVPHTGNEVGVYFHEERMKYGVRFLQDGYIVHAGYLASISEAFDLYRKRHG